MRIWDQKLKKDIEDWGRLAKQLNSGT